VARRKKENNPHAGGNRRQPANGVGAVSGVRETSDRLNREKKKKPGVLGGRGSFGSGRESSAGGRGGSRLLKEKIFTLGGGTNARRGERGKGISERKGKND